MRSDRGLRLPSLLSGCQNKMECLHFSTSNFHPETVIKSLKESDDEHRFCSECQEETESKWICLSCGVISCGRYVKGHALEHFKKSKHLFALDLESKACHWYEFYLKIDVWQLLG